MKTTTTKIFIVLFCLSAAAWLGSSAVKNIQAGNLLEFGSIQFRPSLPVEVERESYRVIAEGSVVAFVAYPLMLAAAAGFLRTTRRSFKNDGWLLLSAILLFMFVPVELYCFWLDWKIVGLHYWGEWPVDEFRKALLARVTAMAGLPFIAQLCYYTIPLIILFKPFRRTESASEYS